MLLAFPALGQPASAEACPSSPAQSSSLPDAGMQLTQLHMQDVRTASFPELSKTDLRLRTFRSQSDYFRTRFSLSRFFLPVRMRFFVEVNPTLFSLSPPVDGVCAILAHELSHVSAMSRGNRMREFGLVRLLSRGFTARFERRTDLEAIHRGYGDGLKSYRRWVYGHVPADKLAAKKRNYFSPEEIEAIEDRLKKEPGLYGYWRRHVPLNLGEINIVKK
jgi:hypothetical protein